MPDIPQPVTEIQATAQLAPHIRPPTPTTALFHAKHDGDDKHSTPFCSLDPGIPQAESQLPEQIPVSSADDQVTESQSQS